MIVINTKKDIAYVEEIIIDDKKFEVEITHDTLNYLLEEIATLRGKTSKELQDFSTYDNISKIFLGKNYEEIRKLVKGINYLTLIDKLCETLNSFILKNSSQK